MDTGRSRFFSKEAAVAEPGYSRWLMAAAALLIHFPLGQAYGFSVFNGPLSKVLGASLTNVGWIFSTAIIFLGLAAALFGKWVERVGPRLAMFVSAVLFASGLGLSALGVVSGSLAIVILGYGVVGGMGLGIGYISPVSTLIKWFPDKRGMATGLAIMGFGGGALVGAPLAVNLMAYFKGTSSYAGIPETFATMAVVYFVFQMCAVAIARLPRVDHTPASQRVESSETAKVLDSEFSVSEAIRTPAFVLLWLVLLLNVSAGIGILGQASLMAQKMVGVSAPAAAGFVGLLSICNMAGRIVWSSLSDKIGRKAAYAMYAGVGAAAYCSIPFAAAAANLPLFVALFALVMSFYGAGFSTVPAYLADMFGKKEVGAIHGRLLTAWSLAGVVGPLVVNAGRDYLVSHGATDASAYSSVVYALGCLLVLEFVLNLMIKKPVQQTAGVQPALAAAV
jgi:MFS family permease